MVRCLIFAISPTHIISSICAAQSLHGSDLQATVVTHWPGASEVLTHELDGTVKSLLNKFAFVDNAVAVSQEWLSKILLGSSLDDSLALLRAELGDLQFDEIFYAHDVVGVFYQMLCCAYPNAKRICFGDALGNVYEKEVHLSFLKPSMPRLTLVARIRTSVARLLYSNRPDIASSDFETASQPSCVEEVFRPHEAALILPVDQSGNFLKDISLHVCEKSLFVSVVQQCIESTYALNAYIHDVLEAYRSREKLLVLTENIAEGNFMDFDTEIDMWCSVIQKHCEPNGVVFLKSHPGETLPRNGRIKARLEGVVEVVELDKRFRRYPIEIWRDLLLNSKVACMSYPVLSLKYLYNIDVIQPMNDAFIEKWFPEWTWASYKNALSLYMEPLKRLPYWDGDSVLWSGQIAN